MPDNVVYPATGLTGGTDHDLDGYDGTGLIENDMALVITDDFIYAYTLKADSAAESSPTTIRPDSNPGTFTWHLVSIVDAHTHDGETLQMDGITSDGGAFAFTTSGAVTFNSGVNTGALGVTGNISVSGTVDGVDVAALNTAYLAHLHDTETLQMDGVNSDGGAFAFTTSGAVTFSQDVNTQNLDVTGNITVSGTVDTIDLQSDVVLHIWPVGTRNIVAGEGAGAALLAGATYNTLIGYRAGGQITTADNNIAIGQDALRTAITAPSNFIAIGGNSCDRTVSGSGVVIGFSSGFWTTTWNSTVAIGNSASQGWNGAVQQPVEAVAIGSGAGSGSGIGLRNTAVGYQSLLGATSNEPGIDNACLGHQAGYLIITGGNQNSILGAGAGDALQTGSDNCFFGFQAGDTNVSGDGNIIIGSGQDVSGAAASNELNIGGVITGDLSANTVIIPNGTLNVGVDDTTAGAISVYGHTTGSVTGGTVNLFTAADHDTTINQFIIQANQDNFQIGPDTDADSFGYSGASNKWAFTVTVAAVGAGGLEVGIDHSVPGVMKIYGDTTASTTGGLIDLYVAADHDNITVLQLMRTIFK
jgi:hypothetical protein